MIKDKPYIITQPDDFICKSITDFMDEQGIDYNIYFVGSDITINEVQALFPTILGTPIVYINGNYIADVFKYFDTKMLPRNTNYRNERERDNIIMLSIPDCRGCKLAREIFESYDIMYDEFKEGDPNLSPALDSEFFKAFFGEIKAFPAVFINGILREDWREYIESGEVVK